MLSTLRLLASSFSGPPRPSGPSFALNFPYFRGGRELDSEQVTAHKARFRANVRTKFFMRPWDVLSRFFWLTGSIHKSPGSLVFVIKKVRIIGFDVFPFRNIPYTTMDTAASLIVFQSIRFVWELLCAVHKIVNMQRTIRPANKVHRAQSGKVLFPSVTMGASAINMRYIVTGSLEPPLNTILAHSEIYIVCGDDKGV